MLCLPALSPGNPPVCDFAGKLIETLDDHESWTVQWYNIKDVGVAGKSRVTNAYLPCWIHDETGVEVRSPVAPPNHSAMVHTVKRKRFRFDPFELLPSGRLPTEIKSALRGQFSEQQLSF